MKTIKTTYLSAFALVLGAAAQTEMAQLEGPRGARFRFATAVAAANAISLPDPVWLPGSGNNKVAMLRIAGVDTAAYRIHFEEFGAPGGARVFVYGTGPDGAITSVFGPYTTAGPTGTGEFLSPAISGREAVIEVQSPQSIAWPFRLGGVAQIDAATLARMKETGDRSLTESTERGRLDGVPFPCSVAGKERWCELRPDKMVFQGDIVIAGPEDEAGKGIREAIGITGAQYRWPGGKIPYTVNANMYPDPESGNPDSRITQALMDIERRLPGLLVRRTNQADYVEFRWTSDSACSSSVGRRGGRQYINIADGCSTGSLVHEILHAAGLWHEQSREDRDNHVVVSWENIEAGREHNFEKQTDDGDDIGEYDFGSIMHYGRFAFSRNGRATLTTIPAGIAIGQRTAMSDGDVAGVKKVQCTYTLNPASLQVGFEGGDYQVRVTAPPYCDWTARSGVVWVQVTSGSAGTGNGVVTLSVLPSHLPVRHSGTVTVFDRTLTVTQAAFER